MPVAVGARRRGKAPPYPAGRHILRLVLDGIPREVMLIVPSSYDGAAAVPLVLDLHASSITPEIELAVTRLDAAAEAEGFLLALPVAVRLCERGGAMWNVPRDAGWPDDVAFIGAVLDAIEEAFCIDAGRIYAAGYSGGARLASELAHRMPARIAAISAIGGLRGPGPDRVRPANPPAILAVHGLADPVNPFDGDPAGSPDYWTYGVHEAIRRWRAWLGCSLAPKEINSGGVTRLELAGCVGGGALTVYSVEGLGHTWPGSPFAFPAYTGATVATLDATRLTLDWFARHPRQLSVAGAASR